MFTWKSPKGPHSQFLSESVFPKVPRKAMTFKTSSMISSFGPDESGRQKKQGRATIWLAAKTRSVMFPLTTREHSG